MGSSTGKVIRWEDAPATLEPRLLLDVDLAGSIVDLNGAAEGYDHAAEIVEDDREAVALAVDGFTIEEGDEPISSLAITVDRARNDAREAIRVGGLTLSLNEPQQQPAIVTVGSSQFVLAFDEIANTLLITDADGGTIAADDLTTLLRNAQYSNTSQNPLGEERIVSFLLTDAAGVQNTSHAAITLTGFNDAPVVEDDPVDPFIPSTPQADGDPGTGRSVAALLSGTTIIDPEQVEFGIAIVSADVSLGTWEVLEYGATEWTVLASADQPHPADRTTPISSDARVRFVPNEQSSGTAEITFRVWDGTALDGADGVMDGPEIGLSDRLLSAQATFEAGTRSSLTIEQTALGPVLETITHDIQHGSGTAWQVGENYTNGDFFTANDLRRGNNGGYSYAFDGEPGEYGIATLFNARALTFEPADGAITSFSASLDVWSVGRDAGAVHFAIRQGGVTYYTRDHFLQTAEDPERLIVRSLAATDFVRIDGQEGHPDFSENGAPIVLGEAFSGTIAEGDTSFNGRTLIDNAYFEIERERAGGNYVATTYPEDGGLVAIAPAVDIHPGSEGRLTELRVEVFNALDPQFSIVRIADANFTLAQSQRIDVLVGSSIFEVEYSAERQLFTITGGDPTNPMLDPADLDALIQSMQYADAKPDGVETTVAFSFVLVEEGGERSDSAGVVFQPDRAEYVVSDNPQVEPTTSGGAAFTFTSATGADIVLDGEIVETDVPVGFYSRGAGGATLHVGAGETTIAWTLTQPNGDPIPQGILLTIPDLSFVHAESFSVPREALSGYILEENTNITVVDDGTTITFTAAAGDRGPANSVALRLADPSAFEITYRNDDPEWRNDFVHDLGNATSFERATYRSVSTPPDVVLDPSAPDGSGAYEIDYRPGGAAVSVVPPTISIAAGEGGLIERATVLLSNAGPSDELVIGALPSGIVGTIDTNVDGTIRVVLSGTATAENYEVALAAIGFRNASESTVADDRTLMLSVWNGENGSEPAATTVALNFPAFIDLNGASEEGFGHATLFVENGQPAPIVGEDVQVTDIDENVIEAVIVLRDGRIGDTLNVDSTTLAPDFSAASVNGTTLSADGELTITLYANRSVTAEDWERALSAITFEANTNTPERMDERGRSITVQLIDEDGARSNAAVTAIAVREVNDVPYLDLDRTDETARRGDYEGTWVEGDGPVPLSADILIADLDDATLSGASVVAVNPAQGDILLVGGEPATDGASGTIGSLAWRASAANGQLTVTITGTASVADYRDALGQFTFDNRSGDPTDGTRRFAFTVSDGRTDSPTRIARIATELVNDPPVAVDDGPVTVVEDTVAEGNVLVNDYDPDGTTLRVISFTIGDDPTVHAGGSRVLVPGVGNFVLAGDGAWSFTPAADYTGTVPHIDYTIADADGATAEARLTFLPVSERADPPVAADDRYAVVSDERIVAADVLLNDTDPDGDPLQVVAVNGGDAFTIEGSAGGTGSFASDGSFSFDPGNAFDDLADGEVRLTRFTYTITDPSGREDTAEVVVEVRGVNDAPSMAGEQTRDDEDTEQNGNVLVNDVDPEGEPLAITSFDGTAMPADGTPLTIELSHGSLTISPDGAFSFVPNNTANAMAEGDVWQVDLPYTASDGALAGEATLRVIVDGVNDPLVVVDPNDPSTHPTDPAYQPNDPATPADPDAVVPPVDSLIDNTPMQPIDLTPFFGDAESDPITITVADGPDWVSIDPDTGLLAGTPPADASVGGPNGEGTYAVLVEASTPFGDTATTTVVLTVANVPPVAEDDAFATTDSRTVAGSLFADNGGGPDRDGSPDADPIGVVGVNGGPLAGPVAGSGGGTFTVEPDGTFVFDPNGEFNDLPLGASRDTTITYTIGDGAGGQASATVTVTVTNANEPPRFIDPADAATEQDGMDAVPLDPVDLDDYVIDPEGRDLRYEIGPMPTWLTFDPITNTFRGTPSSDASVGGPGGDGVYRIPVRAIDPAGRAFDFVHEVRIGNPGPLFLGPEPFASVPIGTPIEMPIAALFADPDADVLVFGVEGLPPSLAFDAETATIHGTAPAWESDWTLTLTVDDRQGGTAVGSARVNVFMPERPTRPEDPPPIDTDPPLSVPLPPREIEQVRSPEPLQPTSAHPSGIVLGAVNGIVSLDGTACLDDRGAIRAAIGAFETIEVPGTFLGGEFECHVAPGLCARVETLVEGDRVAVTIAASNGIAYPWRIDLHGVTRATATGGMVVVDRPGDRDVVCGDVVLTLPDERTATIPIRIDLSTGSVERRGAVVVRDTGLSDVADGIVRAIDRERDRGMPTGVSAVAFA